MMEPPYYYAIPETSVLMVIVYFLFVSVVTCYMYVMLNMEYIKQNWQKEKCRYGLVIGGEKNVAECSQQVLKQVVDKSTKPLYYTADVLSQFFRELAAQKSVIGNALEYVKSQIVNIVNKILEVISKLFIPVQITLTTVFNIFSKVKAVILAQMYFILGTMLTMKTAIETIINVSISCPSCHYHCYHANTFWLGYSSIISHNILVYIYPVGSICSNNGRSH